MTEEQIFPVSLRIRSHAERLAYVAALDRSLMLDDGHTPEQERWRRIGPSARRLLRDLACSANLFDDSESVGADA